MKPKTDEEIIQLKHKLEAKGYVYTSTDQEWIAHYRYVHAPLKEQIKRKINELKQWIVIHPRTTLVFGLLLFLLALMSYPAFLALQIGARLMRGEIVTTVFTLSQLTGFVLLLSGLVFFMFVFIVFHVFADGTWSVVEDDEAAYKRKLKRQELAFKSEA